LTQPSPRSDATAIGGLALAFFTRPQFLVLAAILLLAVLLLEGPRAALGRHRLLAGACVLAILVVVPLAALGETHRLLGDYGVTATQGSVLPPGIWKSAAIHIDLLALGLGVLPFLLGVGWTYSNFRGGAGAKRAFAVFTGLALPLLALETASYDVRFGGVDVFRTRYLFYLTPLLLLASAAALVGRLPVWGIVGATVFFSATIAFAGLPRVAGILLDSGESVLNGVIRDLSPGLPAGVFIALCGLALGGICLAFQWLPRPLVLVGASVLTFAFCASTTGYAFERLLSGNTAAGFPVTGQDRVRDWVDRAAEGRSVAVLAYPVSRDWGYSAIAWWDAEFWNNTIRRAFIGQNGRWTYTPFAATTARFDPATGEAPDTDKAPKLVLVAPSDSRFGLVGKQVVANAGLALMKVKRPWRAAWTSTGLYPDGWIHPNHPARVRIYSGRNAPTQIFKVAVILDSPPEATHDVSYRVGTATGTLAPTIRAEPQTRVCVPAGGHADITLQSQRAATIGSPPIAPVPGPTRNVGLIVSGVQLSPTGNPCSPG
jgi:hypothetical protein